MIMSKDFTKSVKTKAGWPVKGLFEDGKFIRGYFLSPSGFWKHDTWFKSNGKHVISEPGIRDYDLVEPEPITLKPLSELHKDEEACRRVAALLFGEPLSRNIGVNRWDGGTTFWYMGHSIDIEDDGEFGYEVTDSSSGKTVNIFALVDLIRELGYEPEKKEL